MITSRKIRTDINNRLNNLKSILQKEKDIKLAYLFGSYAKGKVLPLSDIDIAVLLDTKRKNKIPVKEFIGKEQYLFSLISRILQTDEIDLVILNSAPISLKFSILKNGKILYCKDDKERAAFAENVIIDYLDTLPLREELFSHLKERMFT